MSVYHDSNTAACPDVWNDPRWLNLEDDELADIPPALISCDAGLYARLIWKIKEGSDFLDVVLPHVAPSFPLLFPPGGQCLPISVDPEEECAESVVGTDMDRRHAVKRAIMKLDQYGGVAEDDYGVDPVVVKLMENLFSRASLPKGRQEPIVPRWRMSVDPGVAFARDLVEDAVALLPGGDMPAIRAKLEAVAAILLRLKPWHEAQVAVCALGLACEALMVLEEPHPLQGVEKALASLDAELRRIPLSRGNGPAQPETQPAQPEIPSPPRSPPRDAATGSLKHGRRRS